MDDPGHHYSFGAPKGGWPMWPVFGPILPDHQAQSEEHADNCAVCRAQTR